MPYVVFWSNIMGKFVDNNETRISNSPVEGYFSIMKNKTLRGKKNVRPTEYIRSTHGYIHAKINEVECKHLCTPCKEKKVKNTELVEEVWDRTPKKLKENLNKKMVLGERCFKTDDIILSGKFPKNLKNIKILYAKYGHIFEYVDESVKSFRTTSILFNEMESLNPRKEIFNHILEIYIHILVFENKMKNVAICTCEEGEAIFFMKDTSLDLKNIFEIEKKSIFIIPILRLHHFTLFFANFEEKTFCYIDPMGAKCETVSEICKKFLEILGEMGIASEDWRFVEKSHTKQTDWYNCGVLCCQFSECLIKNTSLDNVANPNKYRQVMKSKLLKYRKDMSNECIHCEDLGNSPIKNCNICQRPIDQFCLEQYYELDQRISPNFKCHLCTHVL